MVAKENKVYISVINHGCTAFLEPGQILHGNPNPLQNKHSNTDPRVQGFGHYVEVEQIVDRALSGDSQQGLHIFGRGFGLDPSSGHMRQQ